MSPLRLGEGMCQRRNLALVVQNAVVRERLQDRDQVLRSSAIDRMLSGKLRKGAIGAISDQQRPLDGRQKVLLHVVEVAREVGAQKVDQRRCRKVADAPGIGSDRSEEHTSELQSLMRISYAVFCLKKKIRQQHI